MQRKFDTKVKKCVCTNLVLSKTIKISQYDIADTPV